MHQMNISAKNSSVALNQTRAIIIIEMFEPNTKPKWDGAEGLMIKIRLRARYTAQTSASIP